MKSNSAEQQNIANQNSKMPITSTSLSAEDKKCNYNKNHDKITIPNESVYEEIQDSNQKVKLRIKNMSPYNISELYELVYV